MKETILTPLNRAISPCVAALVLVASAAGAADYASTVLADNPIGYYRFEEPINTTNLADSALGGVPASVYYTRDATNPVLGQVGIQTNSAFFFGAPSGSTAGRPGTVDVPFRQELSPTNVFGLTNSAGYLKGGPFSVECWTRSYEHRTDSKYDGIVAVTGPFRNLPTKWGGWMLGKEPSNHRWVFMMRNASTLQSLAVPELMQWYHLVATFDGTNSALYVNGELQSSGNEEVNKNYVPSNFDGVSRMGNIGNSRFSDNPWAGYKGDIDEVAFYTNALTSDQIQAHYQAGTNSMVVPAQPPVILTDLADATNFANTPITLSVGAGGDQPLSYQWLRADVPINGATNSEYTFTSTYPADDGATFSVVVTNNSGADTSAVARLTVSTDLLTSPTPEDGSLLSSITRNVGSYAAFRVVAYGAQPVTYKWFKNGAPLAGETNRTLWLSNVQMSDSGNTYSVEVSNPWNSTTLMGSLSAQERPASVPLEGYAAIVAADKPVAYWRLDETAGSTTALDVVGSFNGQYTDISSSWSGLFTWESPCGIPSETNPAATLTNGAVISIPYATELNPDRVWSAETWVCPSAVSDSVNVNYVVFSSEYNHSRSSYDDWTGWYVTHGFSRQFNFLPEPAGGDANLSAGPDDPENQNRIVPGKWYHLVVSADGTNFNMFINGKLRVSRPMAQTPFLPNGAGVRPEDGVQGHGETMIGSLYDRSRTPFAGSVDDTALYNYALNPEQVLQHYLNSTNLSPVSITIQAQGDKVVLTWPRGTLQSAPAIGGPFNDMTTAASPYTNTIGTSTFYRVKTQ